MEFTKEIEKAILGRTERVDHESVCGRKVVERETTAEQMGMMGLKKTVDGLATSIRVRWYGHVLRRMTMIL